ncbi:P-loop NTPase fold protein [Mucilaginibacter sp. KACC 22773]|uniref:P-loop NTPase fold protein n=1 Tax=Mucilaginibacter sp. KACC 22773 TaxID=3025671 RepID=UPI002365442F|nr:P-loop NTPase fold protein [Mucilaginibacter sp. KACC 22773]WDF75624.1 P-loop NTPase fold protein [Mucilaginibacter sp. KACC 22773]
MMEDSFPQLLTNAPVGEDLFEGQSQARVGEYISKNISINDTCQIIGIDGGWGSGKSNLIEIIKSKLEARHQGKYRFFIYDAWGHQEDLQRRSILEELTHFLTADNKGKAVIEDFDKWTNKLKQLLAKSKETQKRSIPSLSLGIVFSGLILILTPLFKSISEFTDCNWLKVVITAIPVICLMVFFIYYYCSKTSKTLKVRQRLNEAVHKLFHIYQQTQKEEITFETISEDEPSVKKFRDWMKAISEDLGKNRLVIVFDNMDRLPDQKITELWSSIHTFFAESRYDKIKVLIPFDRQNIKNAFKHNEEPKRNYTDDFINKTFDVVYRVSPPILSDWRKYFEIKWTKAFNELGEEFQKVIQVFDHLANTKTPREIVVFINECVTTSQINTNVPLRYVALFVVAKSTILSEPDQQIVNPSYLGSLNFLYQPDEKLPQYIAALIYQIDHERSLEVIFTDKLKSALDNNDVEEIQSISEYAVFQVILEKTIVLVENYENAVNTLNDLGDKIKQQTWDDLYYKLNPKVESVKDAKVNSYQLVLLQKVSDKKGFLKGLINLLINSSKFIATDYYDSIRSIENTIKSSRIDLEVKNFLKTRRTPADDFINLIKSKDDSNTYKITVDELELNDALIAIRDKDELENSSYLSRIKTSYNLKKYTDSLETRITEEQSDRQSVSALYQAYKNASKGTVKVLLNDSYIYTHFVNLTVKDVFYYDIISMRIAKWNDFQSYSSYFVELLQSTDDELIKSLSMQITSFIEYGDILINLLTFESPLVKSVASFLTENPPLSPKISLLNVLKDVDAITTAINLPVDTIIKRLNNWDSKIITIQNVIGIIKNTNFLEGCLKISNNLTLRIIEISNAYFNTINYDTWQKEFSDPNSTTVKAALIVLKNQFSAQAVSAVKICLLKIAKSELPIPDKDVWINIIFKCNINSIRSAVKDVRDLFLSAKEIDSTMFKFFGSWLFEHGDLNSQPSALRRICRKEVLEDPACVSVIVNYHETIISIYQNSEEKEDFNNELQVLIDEGKNYLSGLIEILGIKLKDSKDNKR